MIILALSGSLRNCLMGNVVPMISTWDQLWFPQVMSSLWLMMRMISSWDDLSSELCSFQFWRVFKDVFWSLKQNIKAECKTPQMVLSLAFGFVKQVSYQPFKTDVFERLAYLCAELGGSKARCNRNRCNVKAAILFRLPRQSKQDVGSLGRKELGLSATAV